MSEMRIFNEVRNAARERLIDAHSEHRNGGGFATVAIVDRQDPIPRALILDGALSSGAVRAYAVLVTFCPTPFPGARRLGLVLGGADGAVRTTDELFLSGWIVKEIVCDEKTHHTIGALYVPLPRRNSPVEMHAKGVGWKEFVLRLATPTHAKKDKKAALRKRAKEVIAAERGVFTISESAFSESAKRNESSFEDEVFPQNEVFQKKPAALPPSKNAPSGRSLEEKFGLVFPSSLRESIRETELVRVATYFKLDVDQLRRAIGEFSREALVGFRVDAESAWFHLCQLQASEGLHHTAIGDANFPEFGGMR